MDAGDIAFYQQKMGTVTIGYHRLRIGDSHRYFLFTTLFHVLSRLCWTA